MKRTAYILTAALFSCVLIVAQTTEIDGLKFIQSDISGTARYVSMAGAFGALGGDASAIKDNPAGLGIYRSSELTTTLNIYTQNSKSTWGGVKSGSDRYNSKFDNFTYVISSPTWNQLNERGKGLLFSNFSFSYNRLKNFDKNVSISGEMWNSSMSDYMAHLVTGAEKGNGILIGPGDMSFENIDVSWLSVIGFEGFLINETTDGWQSEVKGEKVKPQYSLSESGSVNEYAFAWSGNFGNRFYLGASLNIQSINYHIYSNYREDFVGRNGNFNLKNEYSTSGIGSNIKIGAIFQPADFMRLGLSYQTPTFLSIDEVYYPSLEYDLTHSVEGKVSGSIIPRYDNGGQMKGSSESKIKNPAQLNASIAYLFGKKGLFSAEYVFNNYGAMKYYNSNGVVELGSTDEAANKNMKNILQSGHTIKIGGEFRATDQLSLRAGFATATAATQPNATKEMFTNTIRTDSEYFLHKGSYYITAGLGYKGRGWYIDFAWMNKTVNEEFRPYNTDDIPLAEVITQNNNFLATFGLRF